MILLYALNEHTRRRYGIYRARGIIVPTGNGAQECASVGVSNGSGSFASVPALPSARQSSYRPTLLMFVFGPSPMSFVFVRSDFVLLLNIF